MNRRGFLKLFGAAALVAIAPAIVTEVRAASEGWRIYFARRVEHLHIIEAKEPEAYARGEILWAVDQAMIGALRDEDAVTLGYVRREPKRNVHLAEYLADPEKRAAAKDAHRDLVREYQEALHNQTRVFN